MPIRVWFMTLVEYSQGTAKIIKSFTKPAKDSDAKQAKKEPKKTFEKKEVESEDMFGDYGGDEDGK